MKNTYFILAVLALGVAVAPFTALADTNISLSSIALILESLQATVLSLAKQVQQYVAVHTTNSTKINNDGVIESYEWNYMESKWFSSDKTADINGDGIVNSIDFGILNSGWNTTTH